MDTSIIQHAEALRLEKMPISAQIKKDSISGSGKLSGFILDLSDDTLKDAHVFLPISMSSFGDKDVRMFEEFDVMVSEVKERTNSVIVSAMEWLEERAIEEGSHPLLALECGSVVEGRVTSIMDYGLFVDLGGVNGLAHVSKLGKEIDCFHIGEIVDVLILSKDVDWKRISLQIV